MWPYNDEENHWFSAHPGSGHAPATEAITPERLDAYMRRAHRLRAEATVALIRALSAAVRGGLFARGRRPGAASAAEDGIERLAGHLRAPLETIRCSAERLRDNPDLPAEQRFRLLSEVIDEDARLVALIDRIVDTAKAQPDGPAWPLPRDAADHRQRRPAA